MGVEFLEDEQATRYAASPASAQSFILSLPIRLGLARDQAGAIRFLVIASIVCIVTAIAVWVLTNHSSGPPDVIRAQKAAGGLHPISR